MRYPWQSWSGLLLVLLFPLGSWADSIPAEEIEVPPPTWSVFYTGEPPPPPVLLPPVESPHDWDSMEPILLKESPEVPVSPPIGAPRTPPTSGVPIVPISWCWLPWLCNDSDDDDGGRPPRLTPPPFYPPGNPPTAPVPEPTAFLVFGLGLALIARKK